MSRIVPTTLGRFRQVDHGDRKEFLFECPVCSEWLPMSEAILAGKEAIDHLEPPSGAVFQKTCSFTGKHEFGAALVSTMQVRVLMDEKPYTEDETERHSGFVQPSV